jgi:hypothetical protein
LKARPLSDGLLILAIPFWAQLFCRLTFEQFFDLGFGWFFAFFRFPN